LNLTFLVRQAVIIFKLPEKWRAAASFLRHLSNLVFLNNFEKTAASLCDKQDALLKYRRADSFSKFIYFSPHSLWYRACSND
jgi:hypothetical protein